MLENFDAMKARLESIVDEVSSEDISLDDALKLYEEAVNIGLSACDASEIIDESDSAEDANPEIDEVEQADSALDNADESSNVDVAQVVEEPESTDESESADTDIY